MSVCVVLASIYVILCGSSANIPRCIYPVSQVCPPSHQYLMHAKCLAGTLQEKAYELSMLWAALSHARRVLCRHSAGGGLRAVNTLGSMIACMQALMHLHPRRRRTSCQSSKSWPTAAQSYPHPRFVLVWEMS
eukprot:1156446-Pelagomonas_calceolata.AAC.5